MNLRRVFILLWKEMRYGTKSFFFLQSVFTPLLLTIFINLLFGNIFTGKPHLGITDFGNSAISSLAETDDTIILKKYESENKMKIAVETGLADIGIVLHNGFDRQLKSGKAVELKAYIWGESHLIDRGILGTTILKWIRKITGHNAPVQIIEETVGDKAIISWKERTIPIVVLLAMVMGGLLMPGTSIADEKEKKTIGGILITPVSIKEIFAAKGLMGFITSLVMGIMILLLNRSFGTNTPILLVLLAFGALMASAFGTLIGSLLKDIETYFSVVKPLIMVIYAPGILMMFPGVPEWIGKIFPTYYILNPVITISQRGGSISDVVHEVLIGIGISLVVIFLICIIARNPKRQTV